MSCTFPFRSAASAARALPVALGSRPASVLAVLLAAVLVAGCATVLPMQPASTLPDGAWRVGGQLNLAPWCGLSGNLDTGCAFNPGGTPLPELRLQARRGLPRQTDVGLSLSASGSAPPGTGFEPAGRVGLLADLKHELWSRSLGPGRRQILSGGPGLGFSLVSVRPTGLRTFAGELELALPVFFGHQTERYEWVAGAHAVARLADPTRSLDGAPPRLAAAELGLVLGVFRRPPGSWSLQLGYRAPVEALGAGAISLSYGLMFDVGAPAAP